MKILVLSSKYHPEYSGSGFRAHSTYKRLKNKYKLDFDLITNSIFIMETKNIYLMVWK